MLAVMKVLVARDSPSALLAELRVLRAQIVAEAAAIVDAWGPAQRRAFALCAGNLAAYIALRRRDVRPLQGRLMAFGLSSLGRCESRVLPNLDAVIASLARVAGEGSADAYPSIRRFTRGERLLHRNTVRIFGATPGSRAVRIMVTLGTDAALDPAVARRLVASGMDCARINCAHDDAAAWDAMVRHVREAAANHHRPVTICMDLGGAKLRTASVTFAGEPRRVQLGDRLFMSRTGTTDPRACVHFACTEPRVFERLRPEASVWINDGKIGTIVERADGDGALLRVTRARPKGEHVRDDKGLNFPDTDLQLPPLTDKDRQDLDFIARHADIVGFSFVNSAGDVAELQRELAARNAMHLTLMLKIETSRAVKEMPALIARGAGRNELAVMIARGDLAVEIGNPRLAEIQEELLWLCEAASVPVVWATAVFAGFVRDGVPSRAEFTDAAMGERAECVMLNKGPYVAEAVKVLDDVIERMEAHHAKKSSRLRALRSW